MQWEQNVAGLVAEEIVSANGGRWPETVEEWQHCVQRFGQCVVFQPRPFTSEHALILRDTLHVPEPSPACPIAAPVYRHELAEAVLLWEGREPYCYPPENSVHARHRVARLLEHGGKE